MAVAAARNSDPSMMRSPQRALDFVKSRSTKAPERLSPEEMRAEATLPPSPNPLLANRRQHQPALQELLDGDADRLPTAEGRARLTALGPLQVRSIG